jgi:hypothetical protein
MELRHLFPAAPSITAEWAPVYFEPLLGSGERLAVAVICRDSEGRGAAKIAVRSAVLKCMYADQAEHVLGLIELVVESFDDHLLSEGILGEWVPPSTSCYIGPIRVAFGESLDSILAQGIKLTASLAGEVEIDSVTEEEKNDSTLQVERFVQQVKVALKQRVQDSESRFNRTVTVRQGAEPTSIGYLGPRLAANFDVLVPDISLTRKRTRAKAKLLDLQALKDQVDLGGGRDSYELLLWVPSTSSPLYSESAFRRSESVFLELQEIGDKHELRVEKMASPEEAASHIFSVEGV